jgi:hypothetical protein
LTLSQDVVPGGRRTRGITSRRGGAVDTWTGLDQLGVTVRDEFVQGVAASLRPAVRFERPHADGGRFDNSRNLDVTYGSGEIL